MFKETFGNEQIYKLSAYFRKKKSVKNEFIFKENQFLDNIYFIYSGEVVLQKRIISKINNNMNISIQGLKKQNNGGKYILNDVF